MARRVLVSLVSKESAPNVTFINEYRAQIHKYIFISSPEMENENRSNAIIQATQINEEDCIIIKVDANIYEGVKPLLDGLDIEDENEFLVNMTGGTKMMALGTYNYFANDKFKDRCQIFYLPLGKNTYQQIYPELSENAIQTTTSIKDYLTSYSLKVLSISSPIKSKEYTESLFQKVLQAGNDNDSIIESLRHYRNNGIKKISDINGLEAYLKDIDFDQNDAQVLSKDEVKYLTGGWFEEWTYHTIKQFIPELIDNQTICLGVNIQQIAQNDFDVVFMMKNGKIHVIECKTYILKETLKDTTIYKSSALRSRFGLAVQSYLFTLSNLRDKQNNLLDALQRRSEAEKVILIDYHILTNESNLLNFFQNLT